MSANRLQSTSGNELLRGGRDLTTLTTLVSPGCGRIPHHARMGKYPPTHSLSPCP